MLTRVISGLIAACIWICACFAGLLPFAAGVTGVAGVAIYELLSAYLHAGAASAGSGRATENGVVAWLGLFLPPAAYLAATREPALADPVDNVLAVLVGVYAIVVSR